MNNEWVDRCVAQRITVLHALPAIERYLVTGQVVLKDKRGGIAPLGSFELCDASGDCILFPAQSINSTVKTQTLAASTGLCAMWKGYGLLTLRFAHQYDGPDFALIGVEEAQTEEAVQLLRYRGFETDTLLKRIDEGDSITCLGAIPGLMRILARAGGSCSEGYSVKEALEGLPEGSYNTGELRPWFAARLRGNGDAG